MVVVVSYCFTSLFDTNGHLSDNVIKTVQLIDEMNDVQMVTWGWGDRAWCCIGIVWSIPTPGCLTFEALTVCHLDFHSCWKTIIEHVCMAWLCIFPLMDQLHILHSHIQMVACNKVKWHSPLFSHVSQTWHLRWSRWFETSRSCQRLVVVNWTCQIAICNNSIRIWLWVISLVLLLFYTSVRQLHLSYYFDYRSQEI